MLFNSYVFIFLFLPITLAGYWAITIRGWRRAAMAWLVVASIFYYGWSDARNLWLILASTAFNYYVGLKLAEARKVGAGKLWVLRLGIGVNLLSLGYFKYANFFVANLNDLGNLGWSPSSIVLPLAISFFTFQKIAYLVDAYQGKAREYDVLDFSLFVMFFPQLIAGPIVHHSELIPQFKRDDTYMLNATRMAIGVTIFVAGLFKKVVLADGVAAYADALFAAAEGGIPTFLDAWGGALSYTLQIYFDFAGYTDMAIGLALMFGVRLPVNFNSPYKATSVIEFWKRWHITLSRFLLDYLYIPLGGNRKGVPRRYLNLMVTMLLGGLWHGPSWTFVFWGGLHGAYLIINHAYRRLRLRFRIGDGGMLGKTAAWLLTACSVVVGWVFFRANSFNGALNILSALAGLEGVILPEAVWERFRSIGPIMAAVGLRSNPTTIFLGSYAQAGCLALLFIGVLALPNIQQWMGGYRAALLADTGDGLRGTAWWQWRPAPVWAVGTGVVAALAIFGIGRVHEFIYFRF